LIYPPEFKENLLKRALDLHAQAKPGDV